jgi:carbon storage regulator CsrA
MLVLSRKVDQEIVIDGNIKIRVLKVKGNTIRLGIDAPQEVHIARGELEKRDSREAQNLPKADDVNANFSVVFDTNAEATSEQPMLLPFEESAEINRMSVADSARNTSAAGESSVEFKGRLPETFHRNRLQEIVNRMTHNN